MWKYNIVHKALNIENIFLYTYNTSGLSHMFSKEWNGFTHKVWFSLIAQQDVLHKLYSLFASIVSLFPCYDCAKAYLHKIAIIFTYVYVEEESKTIQVYILCYRHQSQIWPLRCQKMDYNEVCQEWELNSQSIIRTKTWV